MIDILFVEYKSPAYERLGFALAVERLVSLGYPSQVLQFEYDPTFPVRWVTYNVIQLTQRNIQQKVVVKSGIMNVF